MATVCVIGDLGPGCLDLKGVRAHDRNQMFINLTAGDAIPDITGMTFAAQARKKANDPDPAAITAEVGVADGPAGRLSIRWPGDQVAAVMNGSTKWSGVWDLQQIEDGQDPVTLVAGKFAAEYDVTR